MVCYGTGELSEYMPGAVACTAHQTPMHARLSPIPNPFVCLTNMLFSLAQCCSLFHYWIVQFVFYLAFRLLNLSRRVNS